MVPGVAELGELMVTEGAAKHLVVPPGHQVELILLDEVLHAIEATSRRLRFLVSLRHLYALELLPVFDSDRLTGILVISVARFRGILGVTYCNIVLFYLTLFSANQGAYFIKRFIH